MLDFTITGTVFLHNRPWKAGSEEGLQQAGFTDDQKAHQKRCSAIDWDGESPGEDLASTSETRSLIDETFDATTAAIEAATDAGVDLYDVQTFIGGGRVTKPDVENFLNYRPTTEGEETNE